MIGRKFGFYTPFAFSFATENVQIQTIDPCRCGSLLYDIATGYTASVLVKRHKLVRIRSDPRWIIPVGWHGFNYCEHVVLVYSR